MAKPKGKQPPQKAAVAPTTMKAAAPVKDSVLLPARLQADGAELAQSTPSLRAELTDAFKQALEIAYPSANIEPIVAQTNEPKFGDYQCNNAMALFGQLKGKVHAARTSCIVRFSCKLCAHLFDSINITCTCAQRDSCAQSACLLGHVTAATEPRQEGCQMFLS